MRGYRLLYPLERTVRQVFLAHMPGKDGTQRLLPERRGIEFIQELGTERIDGTHGFASFFRHASQRIRYSSG